MAPKHSKMQFEGSLYRFDITISFEEYKERYPDWEALHKKLLRWCKHFAFQLELSDSGYEHWQVRVSRIHKKSIAQMLVSGGVIECIRGHWSVTSSGVHSSNKVFKYCMKEDTRKDGPWDDTSLVAEKPSLTRQLQAFMDKKFYGWQSIFTSYYVSMETQGNQLCVNSWNTKDSDSKHHH